MCINKINGIVHKLSPLKNGIQSLHCHNSKQFIQMSRIPTFYFQYVLPRLPIPKLEDTCTRYLAAQRPLLPNGDYQRLERLVGDFQKGSGPQLNQLLHQRLATKLQNTSYISPLWFDKYLSSRTPLPINYNPMVVMQNETRPEYSGQLVRATNLIYSSLRFFRSLRSNLLEPDMFCVKRNVQKNPQYVWLCSRILPARVGYLLSYMLNAYPLDMSQYPNLFGSTRIPQTDKDCLVATTEDTKHISVQYAGHFYAINVFTPDGNIVDAKELYANLQTIINHHKDKTQWPLGVLTTLERNEWAAQRKRFTTPNMNVFNAIDTSIMHVCLDTDNVDNDPKQLTRIFLHGDGINRWFDKSFSLIITKDGVAGVNFEHSWGDGVAMLRYIIDIYKNSIENPVIASSDVTSIQGYPERLQFLDVKLTTDMKQYISKTLENYIKTCDNLDINYLIFPGLGKLICKECTISPDAVAQIAFQLAIHKISNSFVSTYESCSTAAFQHGRTEAIRPLTSQVKDFALNNNGQSHVSVAELRRMLNDCAVNHTRLIKEAAMGQGFDRHLYALKNLADLNHMNETIFNDPSYTNLNYDILSTSTLNSPVIQAGGFGPAVTDGYGVGYMIGNDSLGVLVTSRRDKRNVTDFINGLNDACNDILLILQGSHAS